MALSTGEEARRWYQFPILVCKPKADPSELRIAPEALPTDRCEFSSENALCGTLRDRQLDFAGSLEYSIPPRPFRRAYFSTRIRGALP